MFIFSRFRFPPGFLIYLGNHLFHISIPPQSLCVGSEPCGITHPCSEPLNQVSFINNHVLWTLSGLVTSSFLAVISRVNNLAVSSSFNFHTVLWDKLDNFLLLWIHGYNQSTINHSTLRDTLFTCNHLCFIYWTNFCFPDQPTCGASAETLFPIWFPPTFHQLHIHDPLIDSDHIDNTVNPSRSNKHTNTSSSLITA